VKSEHRARSSLFGFTQRLPDSIWRYLEHVPPKSYYCIGHTQLLLLMLLSWI
jgi:hypothetical protein